MLPWGRGSRLHCRRAPDTTPHQHEHDVADVEQRRPDDIGNVRPAADPYVVGRGLRLDHQTASPNAVIAAVTPRRPAAAPAGAKTAGVWLSNTNHHGKSLQGA